MYPGDVLFVMYVHEVVRVVVVCRVQACIEVPSDQNLLVLCGCLGQERMHVVVYLLPKGRVSWGDVDPYDYNAPCMYEGGEVDPASVSPKG